MKFFTKLASFTPSIFWMAGAIIIVRRNYGFITIDSNPLLFVPIITTIGTIKYYFLIRKIVIKILYKIKTSDKSLKSILSITLGPKRWIPMLCMVIGIKLILQMMKLPAYYSFIIQSSVALSLLISSIHYYIVISKTTFNQNNIIKNNL